MWSLRVRVPSAVQNLTNKSTMFDDIILFICINQNNMKNFTIESTIDTPEIIFDVTNKTITFNDNSLPEYGGTFYDDVDKYVNEFIGVVNCELTLIYNITYMNTTSNKRIFHIFKTCSEKANKFEVIWRYSKDDDDMKEQGEIFEHGLGIKFKFESIE